MADLLHQIKDIDTNEETGLLSEKEAALRNNLKQIFLCKANKEEIKWRQLSRCCCFEVDKNTKFFHNFE